MHLFVLKRCHQAHPLPRRRVKQRKSQNLRVWATVCLLHITCAYQIILQNAHYRSKVWGRYIFILGSWKSLMITRASFIWRKYTVKTFYYLFYYFNIFTFFSCLSKALMHKFHVLFLLKILNLKINNSNTDPKLLYGSVCTYKNQQMTLCICIVLLKTTTLLFHIFEASGIVVS